MSQTATAVVNEILGVMSAKKAMRRELKSMDKKTLSEFKQDIGEIIDRINGNGNGGGREGTD